MKKSLLFIFAGALMFACNNNPKEAANETVEIAANSGWSTSHLKGMVKSIEESHYTPDSTGAIGEMDSCCIEITTFDQKGFAVKYTDKYKTGEVKDETVIEYNEDGKFKSAKTSENGKIVWTRSTTRDENGKMLNGMDTDTSGQVSYFYNDISENDIGQALKGKMFSADSVYMGTWSRTYTDGMETGRDWVDSAGVTLYVEKGELNDRGLMAKMVEIETKNDSTTTTIETYTYDSFDETGNWTQRTEYDGDGKATQIEKRTYTYFENM